MDVFVRCEAVQLLINGYMDMDLAQVRGSGERGLLASQE